MSELKTIGVIGAGQMGNGIAHVCALAGYDVLLSDVDAAHIDAAIHTIEVNLARQVKASIIKQADADKALTRIKKTPALTGFTNVDLAIESVVEEEEAKREIFAELRAIASSTANPAGRWRSAGKLIMWWRMRSAASLLSKTQCSFVTPATRSRTRRTRARRPRPSALKLGTSARNNRPG